jgi:hypothetical protein
VLVVAWNDNRPVLLVTTVDGPEPLQLVSRWSGKQKKRITVEQPYTIHKYNEFMGGVDIMDKNVNNYRVSIRSKKWWFCCFLFCLDTAIHNAWQLGRRWNPQMDYLQFRRFVTTTYLR